MPILNNNIEWMLHVLDRMRKNSIDLELSKYGLKDVGHPFILFILRYEMKEMTASQKQIGDAIGISPSTVAISIKRMEKIGLVCKISDKNDLRRNVITLTKKGVEVVEKSARIIDKVDRNVFNGFSQDEIEKLKRFYMRMIHNLELMGAQMPDILKKETDS